MNTMCILSLNTCLQSKFAIMVIDADEEFETYEYEIERVSEILKSEKLWAIALKKLEN